MVFLFRQTSSGSDIKKTSQTGGRGFTVPHQIMAHTGQHLTATLWTGGIRNPLITEVACQGGTLASLHPLPLDEPHTPQSVLMSARMVDYYEKYRARPALYVCFSGYGDERRVGSIPPPPPPSAMVRARLAASSLARYERHPLPPLSSYYACDHSPIRRPSPPSMPRMGNGYCYERFQLSPLSRTAMYVQPTTFQGPLR